MIIWILDFIIWSWIAGSIFCIVLAGWVLIRDYCRETVDLWRNYR